MTREEAFKRLEQMYDFYAHAMDANKNYPLKGDAEAIKVALLVMAQDRSSHITREQVEKMRGKWEWFDEETGTPIDGYEREWGWRCAKCNHVLPDEYDNPDLMPKFQFCHICGAPMTDKAVDMVMERLEKLKNEIG